MHGICYDPLIVPLNRPFIAVIDDDPAIRKTVTSLMVGASYEVKAFPSGVEFLEFFRSRQPDCIVLDIHMPLMNGFEVQTALAQTGKRIPIIILTGHDSIGAPELALAGRPAAYLRKPIDDQELLEAVELALSHNPQDKTT